MKNLAFIITVFILISCKKPLVNFTEPQPVNTKNISSFPQKIVGNYRNYENNSDLHIGNDIITLTNHFQDTLNKNALAELQKETTVSVHSLNDSLYFAKYTITDTLFDLKKGELIRKWKGHYFLNSQNEQNNWEVQKLTYKNGIVSINDITEEESLLRLSEITETSFDTIRPKTYTLTKKQFKEFVKQNGFSEQHSYIKQN